MYALPAAAAFVGSGDIAALFIDLLKIAIG
jgi:hypothetical protein